MDKLNVIDGSVAEVTWIDKSYKITAVASWKKAVVEGCYRYRSFMSSSISRGNEMAISWNEKLSSDV